MDMMQLRRNLLMMQKKKILYRQFSFTLDGQTHTSDFTVPMDNFTILIIMPAFSARPNGAFVDASAGTKYLRFGYYAQYIYCDVGERRVYQYESSGHDYTLPTRVSIAHEDGGNVFYRQNNANKTATWSMGTGSSNVNFDGLTSFGNLIGNTSKRNTGEQFNVYVYDHKITDTEIDNYINNGIIP